MTPSAPQGCRWGGDLIAAARPWVVFDAAGLDVEIASPLGGPAAFGPMDLRDPDQSAFLGDASMSVMLEATIPLALIDPSRYCATWLAGGRGAMWDFPENDEIGRIGVGILAAGGFVAAVGHGGAGLLSLLDEQGEPLVRGRRVTAFSDREERAVGRGDMAPFSLQARLEEAGAMYQEAEPWSPLSVVDGGLVTGQNPASVPTTALAVVKELRAHRLTA
ncbi:type 1 glutamine amidotransferase domain-containing protein [Streptomyces sp. NPDC008343]|uniref:type 1 glutamine amidotransferase domain-containing protein n=1 Tax=Streptomyces sp. NPDC008343 TaxID=3364828 RepID=UPI0036EC2D2E